MAWITHDPQSGYYRVGFRFGGRKFNRSKSTKYRTESDAQAKADEVDRTIGLIEQGIVKVPSGIEVGDFILSGGRLTEKPILEQPSKPVTLSEIFGQYVAEMAGVEGRESSLVTERYHIKHLSDPTLLGGNRPVGGVTFDDVQNYATNRGKQTYRGKRIKRDTIKKELETLRLIWGWAVKRGRIAVPVPFAMKDVILPKSPEKPPFATYDDIQRKVNRGGLSKVQQTELWDSLYLRQEHINEVLDHVQNLDTEPWVYPMFVFVACTGARRGELLRSQIDDFNFEAGHVTIKGTKGTKAKGTATVSRDVRMFPRLRDVMTEWFANHPGGQMALCRDDRNPITIGAANHYFEESIKGTKWVVIKGFHVFRHSFASVLAMKGIDQRYIDKWMGHQTEAMRKRYQHLSPSSQNSELDLLA